MPKDYSREYYSRNWPSAQCRLKRYQAKKRGIPFDLEPSDLAIPPVCPVFGFPLKVNPSEHNKDDSPSIDRLDPTKGYTKGNVFVISQKANRIKNNASIEDLEKVLQWYKNQSTL